MKERIKLGDTISGTKLGLRSKGLRIWSACPVCRIQRWVPLQADHRPCRVCSSSNRASSKSIGHASVAWVNGKPAVGDRAVATDIGRRGKGWYTWRLCPDCGKGRWVQCRLHERPNSRCFDCAQKKRLTGETNPRWNGGVRYDPSHGFYVRVSPDHPFYAMSMSAGGQCYIAEHRLVMAMHLGKLLEKWEVVHHINGDNTDNRLDNLELLPKQSDHLPYNLQQAQIRDLQDRVTQLEAENALLRFQLEGMLIPSQAEGEQSPSGVCRDLTGDIPRG